jgi:segregation and condensation protein B
MNKDLVNKIEAILFYLAEPVSFNFLAKTLDTSKDEIIVSVKELEDSLKSRGIRILSHNDEVSLVTAAEYSDIIEKMIKEERERDLGRSGVETLSIIAYKGPVTKKEIEYIRGVNSQYTLRNLLIRGLIERKNSETDMRVVGYNVTVDALRFLGLSHISDLPEYEEIKKQLQVVEEKEEISLEETE